MKYSCLALQSAYASEKTLQAGFGAIQVVDDLEWPQGRTHYYIRSMLFTKRELHQVITAYSQQYADRDFGDQINNTIQDHITDPNGRVWIRYAGATALGSPLERHQADMDAVRRGQRRFSNFVRVQRQSFPDRVFMIFFMPLLTLNGNFGTQDPIHEELDTTEQVLIHLLGRDMLLNSQPGGHFYSYNPSAYERRLVGSLILASETSYFRLPVNTPPQPLPRDDPIYEQLHQLYTTYVGS